MPREQDFADRVKESLKAVGLTVTALADRWGVDRSALSTRISQDRMSEEELDRLALEVRRPKPWLRYGIEGDFLDGVRWAAARMRAHADELMAEATRNLDVPRHGPHHKRHEPPRAERGKRGA